MSIISPCVPVLTEGDLGVPRLCCLQLLPMLVLCPEHFSWPCSLFQVQASKFPSFGTPSCTTIPFNSSPTSFKEAQSTTCICSWQGPLRCLKKRVTYWKKKRERVSSWRRGFLPYPPSFSVSSLFLVYNGGSQNVYLNQWIFSVDIHGC